MESDQNLGINKIPLARPIFVLVPGLQNIIFLYHRNISACKKSAPCGPSWSPFGPTGPRLANVAHMRTFLPRVHVCVHGSLLKFLCEFSTITYELKFQISYRSELLLWRYFF